MTDEDLKKAEALALKFFPVDDQWNGSGMYDRNENQREAFVQGFIDGDKFRYQLAKGSLKINMKKG